ncbi:MAG: hypothetical protein RIC53_08465 [Cyclobacteriaceae bacterium]
MKKSLTAILLVACFGCNVNDLDFSDLQAPTLSGLVALPIGTIDYTMREMIAEIGDTELQLEEDSTSLLKLTYFDTASFNSGGELVSIADVNNSETIVIPAIDTLPESQVAVYEETFEFTYPPENNEALDSVFYKAGSLQLSVTSNIAHDISYSFTIRQTINTTTREPVSFEGNLGALQTTSDSKPLVGHRTSLEQMDTSANVFLVDARISVFLNQDEGTTGSETLELSLSYVEQEFSVLYGKFGQDTLQVGNEVLNLKFFEELGESGLKFGSPELTFDFSNSFGIPLGILFNGMYVVDSTARGLDTTYLTGDAATESQVIAGAESLGESASSKVYLNTKNSSIRNLLSSSPRTMGFSLTAIANPLDAGASNFVIDTSKISTNIEMSLPLELSLDNVERVFDFKLGSGLKFDESDSVSIRIVSENELPFAANVAVEILGENDSLLYTIPSKLVLEIPFLDLNGLVTQARKHTADLPINQVGIDALATGEKIRIRLTLNTPTGSREIFVKILADYSLNIKLAAIGKLKVDL